MEELSDMGDMEDVKVEEIVIHQLAKDRLSWGEILEVENKENISTLKSTVSIS